MPARQRGQVLKEGKTWAVRWYDECSDRQYAGGFPTKTAARDWVTDKVAEVDVLRRGDHLGLGSRISNVNELIDLFLPLHAPNVESNTLKTLSERLKHARRAFGDRAPSTLLRIELEVWRQGLPRGSRQHIFRALRQVLQWAVDHDLLARNPSDGIRNPGVRRDERRPVYPFESWDELEAIGSALIPPYAAIPVVATGLGLRPEEWIALHRTDIDREQGRAHIQRVFTKGELKYYGKTYGSIRTVPLRREVLNALDAHPTRIDTPLLFPNDAGGYINLDNFRERDWYPAQREAGVDRRVPYHMRHTFATWAIDTGMPPMQLATIMGTSVAEIERTYARWLPRTDDQIRALFDKYDEKLRGVRRTADAEQPRLRPPTV